MVDISHLQEGRQTHGRAQAETLILATMDMFLALLMDLRLRVTELDMSLLLIRLAHGEDLPIKTIDMNSTVVI